MAKKTLALALSIISITTAALISCNSRSVKETKTPLPTEAEMIKRGEYLVASIGCDDCHSPKRFGSKGPELIPELRFSGYPADRLVQKADTGALKKGWALFAPDLTLAVGPWGMSFAANISSDETGIGNWTEGNFITAMRTGKVKGMENGRQMLPPMPWMNFKNLTDEDLKAIFQYLKSQPPVPNRVPAPKSPAEL